MNELKQIDNALENLKTSDIINSCTANDINLGNGVVNILADEDMNDTTLTFTTDYPSTVYALVYKDVAEIIQAQ